MADPIQDDVEAVAFAMLEHRYGNEMAARYRRFGDNVWLIALDFARGASPRLSAAKEEGIREERERCAKIAEAAWPPAYTRFDDGEWIPASPYDRGAVDAGNRIAALIRKEPSQ